MRGSRGVKKRWLQDPTRREITVDGFRNPGAPAPGDVDRG